MFCFVFWLLRGILNSLMALRQKMRTDYVCVCVCVRVWVLDQLLCLFVIRLSKEEKSKSNIRDPCVCVCLTRWQNKSCFHRNGSKEKLEGRGGRGRVVCDVTDASVPLGWTHLSNASRAHTHTDPDNTRLKSETGQHSWFGVALHLLPIRFRRAGPNRRQPTRDPLTWRQESPNRVTLALHFSLCLWFSLLGLDANRFEHVAYWFRWCCCC